MFECFVLFRTTSWKAHCVPGTLDLVRLWTRCFFFPANAHLATKRKKHARLRFRCDYHLNRQGEIAQAGGAGRLKNDGLELAPQIFDIMQHHLFWSQVICVPWDFWDGFFLDTPGGFFFLLLVMGILATLPCSKIHLAETTYFFWFQKSGMGETLGDLLGFCFFVFKDMFVSMFFQKTDEKSLYIEGN